MRRRGTPHAPRDRPWRAAAPPAAPLPRPGASCGLPCRCDGHDGAASGECGVDLRRPGPVPAVRPGRAPRLRFRRLRLPGPGGAGRAVGPAGGRGGRDAALAQPAVRRGRGRGARSGRQPVRLQAGKGRPAPPGLSCAAAASGPVQPGLGRVPRLLPRPAERRRAGRRRPADGVLAAVDPGAPRSGGVPPRHATAGSSELRGRRLESDPRLVRPDGRKPATADLGDGTGRATTCSPSSPTPTAPGSRSAPSWIRSTTARRGPGRTRSTG
jgi:hypothetical protein